MTPKLKNKSPILRNNIKGAILKLYFLKEQFI